MKKLRSVRFQQNKQNPALTAAVGISSAGERCISLLGSKGEEGRRRLPKLPPQDGPRCLNFWHFLNGADEGELSIIVT